MRRYGDAKKVHPPAGEEIRTLKALRRAVPAPAIFRLFLEDPLASPAFTAPPRLATEEGRGKRKRAHTGKYQQAVEDGDLDESQQGKQH
jgi:hypothetical protein